MDTCPKITLLSSAWFRGWKSSMLICFHRNVNRKKKNGDTLTTANVQKQMLERGLHDLQTGRG